MTGRRPTASESGPWPLPESPARIVLDMADTESGVDAGKVPVGQGAVQQYSAVSAGGRTRLVVDLTQPVAYDYSAEASQVVLTLAGGSQGAAAAATPMAGGPAVTGIDFRLGESGQAKVIVNTNRAGASMSVQEKPDGLTVDLFGASLPESLDQRLDVTDFATPVQFIDSFGVASGVRLELKTYGLYEHMTYESGNEFVIEVSQMSQAVQAAEESIDNGGRTWPERVATVEGNEEPNIVTFGSARDEIGLEGYVDQFPRDALGWTRDYSVSAKSDVVGRTVEWHCVVAIQLLDHVFHTCCSRNRLCACKQTNCHHVGKQEPC